MRRNDADESRSAVFCPSCQCFAHRSRLIEYDLGPGRRMSICTSVHGSPHTPQEGRCSDVIPGYRPNRLGK